MRERTSRLFPQLIDRVSSNRSPLTADTDLERLIEIRDDVVHVLDADAEPDEVGRHTRRRLLFRRKLFVGRRRRMDHKALGVADVSKVAEEFQRLDEPDRPKSKGNEN